jgi:hypothetical protein
MANVSLFVLAALGATEKYQEKFRNGKGFSLKAQ